MRANEVMKELGGISRQTLKRYREKGYLKCKKLPTGHFDYDIDSVLEFQGQLKNKKNVFFTINSQCLKKIDEQKLKIDVTLDSNEYDIFKEDDDFYKLLNMICKSEILNLYIPTFDIFRNKGDVLQTLLLILKIKNVNLIVLEK